MRPEGSTRPRLHVIPYDHNTFKALITLPGLLRVSMGLTLERPTGIYQELSDLIAVVETNLGQIINQGTPGEASLMPWVLGGGKHETGLAAIEGPVRKVGGVLGHT